MNALSHNNVSIKLKLHRLVFKREGGIGHVGQNTYSMLLTFVESRHKTKKQVCISVSSMQRLSHEKWEKALRTHLTENTYMSKKLSFTCN